jgi:carbon-monoxide dehydrogenase large subunit
VITAVNDALAPLGVRDFEMPATSARVWAAIQGVRGPGMAPHTPPGGSKRPG